LRSRLPRLVLSYQHQPRMTSVAGCLSATQTCRLPSKVRVQTRCSIPLTPRASSLVTPAEAGAQDRASGRGWGAALSSLPSVRRHYFLKTPRATGTSPVWTSSREPKAHLAGMTKRWQVACSSWLVFVVRDSWRVLSPVGADRCVRPVGRWYVVRGTWYVVRSTWYVVTATGRPRLRLASDKSPFPSGRVGVGGLDGGS